eukprot:2182952-Lingulodinium_polyedra.AAC.1
MARVPVREVDENAGRAEPGLGVRGGSGAPSVLPRAGGSPRWGPRPARARRALAAPAAIGHPALAADPWRLLGGPGLPGCTRHRTAVMRGEPGALQERGSAEPCSAPGASSRPPEVGVPAGTVAHRGSAARRAWAFRLGSGATSQTPMPNATKETTTRQTTATAT